MAVIDELRNQLTANLQLSLDKQTRCFAATTALVQALNSYLGQNAARLFDWERNQPVDDASLACVWRDEKFFAAVCVTIPFASSSQVVLALRFSLEPLLDNVTVIVGATRIALIGTAASAQFVSHEAETLFCQRVHTLLTRAVQEPLQVTIDSDNFRRLLTV